MAKRARKNQKSATAKEFVIVALAEDMEEAGEIRFLLKAGDIPAIIKEQHGTEERGVAVMVPEEFMDEAQLIVESRNSYDEIYEPDVEEDDYEEDFLDDNY